jgi:pSer/pThr/pTyr-binding forkhead associated (FHA) protein
MSRLKVVLRGTIVNEIELSPDKEYIGGRKEGCDIRLQPEKGISREHFKLKYNDGKWQIIAISRFGDVFSLGQKIEQAELQHGQSFHVPPYDFTFFDMPDAAMGAAGPRILQPVNENTKTAVGVVPQVPYIKITDAKGDVREMLRLEVGEVWVAGRDPACQIIIPDQRVSRRQFEVHKVNGAYTILDLASVNGTFLNGTPVSSTDPMSLKSGDAISVLDNIMYFELHDPNFKYKVENIEIPQIPVEAQVEPEPATRVDDGEKTMTEVDGDEAEGTEIDESSQIEQIEEYEVAPQIQAGENPFTGMPGEGPQFDPNQFYTLNQPGMNPGGMPPPPQQQPQKKKLTQNTPLMLTIALVLLGLAYWANENLFKEEKIAVTAPNDADPFSKLTPAQQKEVQELYSLAEQAYAQQKYDLALEKINKIREMLPNGYKDSERIALESEQANLTLVQAEKDAQARKEKEEQEAKLKEVVASCEKLITPNITAAEMNQCLAPVVAINPDHPDYLRLMGEAEKIEKDRQQKEIEARNREQQIEDMKKLFIAAEQTQRDGYAFKSIRKYQAVIDSPLPDPGNLKKIAKTRIEFIKEKIKEKSEASIAMADTFLNQGNLKQAVVTLREAQVYDPSNKDIKDKIESYGYELTRRMREIYQESIIEENYGIIESTETKQGAKDKWKKITELDLEDGVYYKKAIIKLRRYGVM